MNTVSKRRLAEGKVPKAFTLLELLVTIAVLGILTALLLPAAATSKAYSRSVTCKNRLHQLGIALEMYVEEHRSAFPYYIGPPGPSYGDEKGNEGRAIGLVYWSSKLFPYYPLNWTNSLFHCPGYQGTNAGPGYFKGSVDRLGSYAYNIWGSAGVGKKFVNHDFGLGPILFWNNGSQPPVSEAQITTPSAMLSIGESRFLSARLEHVPGLPGETVQSGPGGADTLSCGNPLDLFDRARHGKNYNQLLCDGHVSSMDPSLLFDPTNTAAIWNYDHRPHPELW